jgi:hypothetical protein
MKFRNMLTRDGGIVENDQVNEILAQKGQSERPDIPEVTSRNYLSPGIRLHAKSRKDSGFVDVGSAELLSFYTPADVPERSNADATPSHNLELLSFESEAMEEDKPGTSEVELLTFDQETVADLIETETGDATTSPILTPSISSNNTPTIPPVLTPSETPSPASAIASVAKAVVTSTDVETLLRPTNPLPDALLELEPPDTASPSGALGELASLSISFQSASLGDLAGLYFQPDLVVPVTASESTFHEDLKDMTFTSVDEGIVFKGRRSRKSSPTQPIEIKPPTPRKDKPKPIDPMAADRAFRMFSLGVKALHK